MIDFQMLLSISTIVFTRKSDIEHHRNRSRGIDRLSTVKWSPGRGSQIHIDLSIFKNLRFNGKELLFSGISQRGKGVIVSAGTEAFFDTLNFSNSAGRRK
jgi:hypothetical protein